MLVCYAFLGHLERKSLCPKFFLIFLRRFICVPMLGVHTFSVSRVQSCPHLEYSQIVLGTDIARQLRQLQFDGLICIRSADDAPEDREKYAEHADCSFGKDILGSQMLRVCA